MKQLAIILAAVAVGGGAVYLYNRTRAPAAPTAPANPIADAFGALLGAVQTGGGLINTWLASTSSGNAAGSSNRPADAFAASYVDLDEAEPTTQLISRRVWSPA